MSETAVASITAPFASYDQGFDEVLGRDPRLVRVVDVDAHEGPVSVAEEDALYFTTFPWSSIRISISCTGS